MAFPQERELEFTLGTRGKYGEFEAASTNQRDVYRLGKLTSGQYSSMTWQSKVASGLWYWGTREGSKMVEEHAAAS